MFTVTSVTTHYVWVTSVLLEIFDRYPLKDPLAFSCNRHSTTPLTSNLLFKIFLRRLSNSDVICGTKRSDHSMHNVTERNMVCTIGPKVSKPLVLNYQWYIFVILSHKWAFASNLFLGCEMHAGFSLGSAPISCLPGQGGLAWCIVLSSTVCPTALHLRAGWCYVGWPITSFSASEWLVLSEPWVPYIPE